MIDAIEVAVTVNLSGRRAVVTALKAMGFGDAPMTCDVDTGIVRLDELCLDCPIHLDDDDDDLAIIAAEITKRLAAVADDPSLQVKVWGWTVGEPHTCTPCADPMTLPAKE